MTIKRPIVTEKSLREYKESNKVTFEVSLDADKKNAKEILEKVYGVKVIDVWTNTRLGKKREDRRNRKLVTKKKDAKLMIFKLNKGDKIDIFESK